MRERIGSRLIGVEILLAMVSAQSAELPGVFDWDQKARRVTVRFEDWPIEEVLTRIYLATDWDVQIPIGSGLTVSGAFNGLPPSKALQRLFGHLNYAVFGTHRGGPPRLQLFIPETKNRKAVKPKGWEPSEGRASNSAKDKIPFGRQKGMDLDGNNQISDEERKSFIERMREVRTPEPAANDPFAFPKRDEAEILRQVDRNGDGKYSPEEIRFFREQEKTRIKSRVR